MSSIITPIHTLFHDCIPRLSRCLRISLKLLPPCKVHGLGETGDDIRVKGLCGAGRLAVILLLYNELRLAFQYYMYYSVY